MGMSNPKLTMLKNEMKKAFSRPWRLPFNMFLAGVITLLGVGIGILTHRFHKGLPYVAAELFVWTLASYNASQLGSDSDKVLEHSAKSTTLKELFIVKNAALLLLAIPIDLFLIVLACSLANDWSRFGLAIILAFAAVIIGLGLGNIVSVVYVYKPVSLWKIRKDRLRLFELTVFGIVSYISATAALLLATIPAALLLKILNVSSIIEVMVGSCILVSWAMLWWVISLGWADKLARRYHGYFVGRLRGETLHIKNNRLKKLLKVTEDYPGLKT